MNELIKTNLIMLLTNIILFVYNGFMVYVKWNIFNFTIALFCLILIGFTIQNIKVIRKITN